MLLFFLSIATLSGFPNGNMLSIYMFLCPDSSGVEHLHGKQAVVGSIPILGKREKNYFIKAVIWRIFYHGKRNF